MRVTVDISMYPLAEDYKPAIKAFIRLLREHDEMTIITNQLSTQINGEFATVSAALMAAMQNVLDGPQKVVFVTRFLNADLDITRLPDLD